MKCTIPEISWHNRDPVLSVDIQPILNNEFYRLATGGTDSHVLIWHLRILETGACSTEPVSDLTRHQRAVNVVRWSPNGQYLASGDDDANIIIWQHKADAFNEMVLDGETQDKEKWSVYKILRGHKEDIYDISWSPNNLKLISGSVDNTAIIWDLNKGNNDNILTDHKGFVQGVCWDPKSDYLATLSSDRICRIFNETGKNVKNRISKGVLNLPESHPLHGQVIKYYHDDTLKSFFRRLTFSPDGNLLITPAGCLEMGENKHLYTTYIYTINNFSQPAAILPSPNQYTIAVKCCPVLFELRPEGPEPAIQLPYRMVIAVATRSSVILYDTQQLTPFAVISNIHYTRLTDLTWSKNGQILVVSSTDGFCSLVTFESGELGVEYVKNEETDVENMEVEEKVEVQISPKETVKVQENIEKEKKRPSFLMQWAKGENKTESDKKPIVMKEKDTNIIVIEDSPKKDPSSNQTAQKIIPMAAKPIEVRRKPREDASPALKSTEVKKQISEAKPIEVRKRPRSELNETKTSSSPSNSEAKPIEVRKKPKPDTSDPNNLPSSSKTEAKPIEVRHKPKEEIRAVQKPNEVQNRPKLPPGSNREAKPIPIRRKPKDATNSSEKSGEDQVSSKIQDRSEVQKSPIKSQKSSREPQKGEKEAPESRTESQESPMEIPKNPLEAPKSSIEILDSPKHKVDSEKIDNLDKNAVMEIILGGQSQEVKSHSSPKKSDSGSSEVLENEEIGKNSSGNISNIQNGSAKKSKKDSVAKVIKSDGEVQNSTKSLTKKKKGEPTSEGQNTPKSLAKKKKIDLGSPSVNSPKNSGSKKKNQMDITKFLKSGPFEKNENKSRVSLFSGDKKMDSQSEKSKIEKMDTDIIILEDSNDATEKQKVVGSPKKSTASPKTLSPSKVDDSTQDMRLIIEDTEDIKLVLEDSDKEIESESQNGLSKSSKSSPGKSKNFIENPKTSPVKINSERSQNCPGTPKSSPGSSKNGPDSPKLDQKATNSQEQKSMNELKNKVSEIHLQSPVQKKKVPFITLSSPKNKKHNKS